MVSKLGSGAASVGKKAAQSEAGKSATRAAVKGATDAATKDLSNRYLGGETTSVPVTTEKTITTAQTKEISERKASTTDSDENIIPDSSYENTRPNRQKPSVFARFKPNINLKGSDKPKPQTRRVVKKKSEKVYKYVLTKEADWESLPQALTLYNYRAEMKCDLEFRKGQVIQVMTRTDSQNDWWEGKLEGRVGIFPANYVKFI